MKKQLLLSAVLAFGVMQISAASGAAHWSYEGHEGPANWGALSHDYSMCKDGKQQSPINISESTKAKLGGIKFSYKSSPKEIVNNGHTIQVNMNKGSSITVNGKKYNLLQFHFHSPSEHTVKGKAADMVIHFVHQAADGQLGVIGVLMNKGNPNKTLASLWKKMPKKAGDKNVMTGKINVKNLLPGKKAYYNYAGSLTTPPCSEGVNWMVMQAQTSVSAAQVKAFTAIFAKSVRPVQALNDRKVSASK